MENKMRSNVEIDRLSSLPDDLIHKILSFIDTKCAIQTSSLSLRWRFVWTSMPYLNFWSADFLTLPKFYKFVTRVLSRRNNQIEVSSLSFCGRVSQVFVKRIMKYVFSHTGQQLTVKCLGVLSMRFPSSLFCSQSLKHLTLTNAVVECFFTPTSTWDLPVLTTLHVSYVRFIGSGAFNICHPRLSKLTLESVGCDMKLRISAPGLSSFHYEGYRPLQFSTDGFHSLERVNLCFRCLYKEDAPTIVGLLQQVYRAQFLILNAEILELLSSSAELLSHQPSSFANLKSLKIYPLDLNEELDNELTMSTEVRNYLLDNSPSATITMVSRKEIRAAKNARLAQKLIQELQVLLEKWKANSETNRAHMETEMHVHHEQWRTHSSTKMQLDLVGGVAQIESYWEDLRVQIEQGKTETRRILSKLLQIEGLLAKLPAWRSAEMQPRFDRVCVEAHTLMNDIIDCKKINCDNKRRRLNAYFHEVATSQPPS